jgi:hypothetical protein
MLIRSRIACKSRSRNFTFDRTAGSRSFAAAKQRERSANAFRAQHAEGDKGMNRHGRVAFGSLFVTVATVVALTGCAVPVSVSVYKRIAQYPGPLKPLQQTARLATAWVIEVEDNTFIQHSTPTREVVEVLPGTYRVKVRWTQDVLTGTSTSYLARSSSTRSTYLRVNVRRDLIWQAEAGKIYEVYGEVSTVSPLTVRIWIGEATASRFRFEPSE